MEEQGQPPSTSPSRPRSSSRARPSARARCRYDSRGTRGSRCRECCGPRRVRVRPPRASVHRPARGGPGRRRRPRCPGRGSAARPPRRTSGPRAIVRGIPRSSRGPASARIAGDRRVHPVEVPPGHGDLAPGEREQSVMPVQPPVVGGAPGADRPRRPAVPVRRPRVRRPGSSTAAGSAADGPPWSPASHRCAGAAPPGRRRRACSARRGGRHGGRGAGRANGRRPRWVTAARTGTGRPAAQCARGGAEPSAPSSAYGDWRKAARVRRSRCRSAVISTHGRRP